MKQFLLTGLLCAFLFSAFAQAIGPWTNTGPINFPVNASGQVNGIGRVSQIKFHPTNPQKMYAVSASGGLYISTNNGVTWAHTAGTETLPQSSCSSVCIDFTNDQILYLSLGDANYYSTNYGIYKSTDGGNTWAASNTGIGTRMAVEILMNPLDHLSLVAATNNGIWKSTDGGATWTQKQTGGFRDMKAQPGSNTVLYAATITQFYYSTNFGDTWTPVTSGLTPPTNNGGMRIAVSAASPAVVYLCTTDGNGVIFKSINSGQSFTQVYSSTTKCIVCYDSTVASGSQGDYNLDLNANPQNANELILVSHCVWRSTDAGATWSKRTAWPTEMHTDMHHIEWNPYNNSQKWSANDGGVWMSTDPVATVWTPFSNGLAATEIYHAAQSPVQRELISIGTQDNGELYYNAGAWKTNRGGDWGARATIDYLNQGTVYYLESGNRRNLLPSSGSDQSYNDPFTPTNNALIEFVKTMPAYAFTGKDSIYRSTNVNTTFPAWSLILPNTNAIRDINSCRGDSNILYVVTNGNHLYRSDNALSATPTFTSLTTPGTTTNTASIATKKSDPNIVFLSCGGGVYRSANKGATWTTITGTGLSGLNIRKILHDDYSTTERLFVNAGSYVHSKDNTGTAWTNYSATLPTVCNATDFMIYNDSTAASILRLSTYGRGVWQCDIRDNQAPSIDFKADKQLVCPGDTARFTPLVYGVVNNYSWSFPGGTPATATTANPVVIYNTPGTYQVSLTGSNASGSATATKTAYIVVSSGQTTAVQQGFEATTFPPADWEIVNNSGAQWTQTNTAGGFGTSTHSIVFDNFNHDAGGVHDNIRAPKVNLTGAANARLKFDVAYAPYSNAYPDTLLVRVSTDCGHNWTTVYSKSGTTLGTTAAQTSSLFVPTSTQWRTDSVSLQPFVNNSLLISFENVGHYGQGIYLDNVNIYASPVSAFGANNTTVCIGAPVTFQDSSSQANGWSWTFPGGTPATSTSQNPVVTYNSSGLFSVSLTTTNNLGNSPLTKTNYIQVLALPTVSITATGNILTATGSTGTYQWYRNGSLIAGATNATYNPIQSGSYTVTITNLNGCVGTSAIYTYVGSGIANAFLEAGYSIFPNPSNGVFTITGHQVTAKEIVLSCYNASGQLVKQTTIKPDNNGAFKETYDWHELARGIYEVAISTTDTKSVRTKIIFR